MKKKSINKTTACIVRDLLIDLENAMKNISNLFRKQNYGQKSRNIRTSTKTYS